MGAEKKISHSAEFGHHVSGRASKRGLQELGVICSGAIGKLREEGKKAIRTIALSELPNRNGRTAARVCLAPAK